MALLERLHGGLSRMLFVAAVATFLPSGQLAWAQDTSASEDDDQIIVTGSRIRRDEFTSAAPLQVFDVDEARTRGITSITEMLQRSTIANGVQVGSDQNPNAGNNNASEPPPTGGVGSSNIGLRGLEPSRTLVLVNGRRFGSAGVRGAPEQPDLSLFPMAMVDRVEVVTEGASSIYGADAVAGVVNLILKDHFEGMEVTASTELPFDGGGETYTASFIMGAQSDDAWLTFGGEFSERKRLSVGQRRDCVENHDIDSVTGESLPVFCSLGFVDNVVFDFFTPQPQTPLPNNSIELFFTPGSTDIGVPNFSSAQVFPIPNAPGQTARGTDLSNRAAGPIAFYSGQYDRLQADLVQPQTSFSAVAMGGFSPDWWGGDEEIYFESYYLNRHAFVKGSLEQIFPSVPGQIRQNENFHIANTGTGDLLYDANDSFGDFAGTRLGRVVPGGDLFFTDDLGTEDEADDVDVIVAIADADAVIGERLIVDLNGDPILADNPLNPFDEAPWVVPVISIDDLAQDRDVQVEQFRFVGGFRGDVPSGALADRNWSYDFNASYDRSTGIVEQPLLNETALILAKDTLVKHPDGSITCGNAPFDIFGFITPQECVPVNLFDPALYGGGDGTSGTFGSDAERDFLIGSRVNNTIVEQAIVSAYFTGDVFELPAGSVAAAFGGEWRRDTIKSFADFLSAKGLNAGENPLAEGPTSGSRDIFDTYLEVNVPLLADAPGAEYLGVEGAVHYTDESNFGDHVTTRARATYRPNDWIQASGSYGTSFRAPNLRESFLAPQIQGVGSGGDPCGIPGDLLVGDIYRPGLDPADPDFTPENRDPGLLANCALQGADITNLGRIANVNLPVTFSGNALSLDPETSRTFTATLQVSPPISDRVDLDLAVSFFDIHIQDAITTIPADIIMSRCLQGEANLANPLCSRLTRNSGASAEFNFINSVDASFVNVGSEVSQGLDFNTKVHTVLENLLDRPLGVTWTTAATIQTKRTQQLFVTDAVDDLAGDFGTPKFRLNSDLALSYEQFGFNWTVRHLSGGETDTDTRLANDCDLVVDSLSRPGPNATIDTCEARGAWYHDFGMNFFADTFTLSAGINNVFDSKPPLVSISAGTNRANRVTSSGYDQLGRSFYFSASAAL